MANHNLIQPAARTINPDDSKGDDLFLKCDLTKPESVSSLFADLRKSWGEPSVVIYNGQHSTNSTPNSIH